MSKSLGERLFTLVHNLDIHELKKQRNIAMGRMMGSWSNKMIMEKMYVNGHYKFNWWDIKEGYQLIWFHDAKYPVVGNITSVIGYDVEFKTVKNRHDTLLFFLKEGYAIPCINITPVLLNESRERKYSWNDVYKEYTSLGDRVRIFQYIDVIYTLRLDRILSHNGYVIHRTKSVDPVHWKHIDGKVPDIILDVMPVFDEKNSFLKDIFGS